MANPGRTQRRAAERAARKAGPAATRDIPPDVLARIQEIEQGQGRHGPGPPPREAPAAAQQGPQEAPQPEAPPDLPGDLPPELQEALRAAAEAAEGAPGLSGAVLPAKKRSKRFTALERELAVLLTLPAPVAEAAGDAYCASHFMVQGPMLAMRLTAYAEGHPAAADMLERAISAGGFAILALAIVSYALPPAMHHGLPAPAGLKRMYHVPDKEHVHHHDPGDEDPDAEPGGEHEGA